MIHTYKMLFADKVELQIEPFIHYPAHHNILYSEIRLTLFRRFSKAKPVLSCVL